MAEIADRYRNVAAKFTTTAEGVAPDAWDRPAPCEGWVARDVVRHIVDWMPAFLAGAGGPSLAPGPSVDDDPVGAWIALDEQLQALLDDPEISARQLSHPQAGSHRTDEAIEMFFLGDVLVHTWDLARATGLDERLDPDEVHGMFMGLQPADEMLRSSGHYGPRVEVPDDADEQTKLLAFLGRRP
ncbi:MAG TPA: TIGR03086 family metal-binding protein [Microthrixaceae bacterium]|nr:TIGR03086 family metal-binding protein [Microthrixaceae bacterium]